jgi:Zn-dependent protease with chaperone function
MGSPVDTATLILICPQGHGPGAAGSLFCTVCGIHLVPPLTPDQYAPAPDHAPDRPPDRPPDHAPSIPPPVPAPPPSVCKHCSGNGLHLDPAEDVCPDCGWLRPLFPGYELDRSVFLWAQDGQAMSTLHKMSALSTIARTVSDKVGRPWIEATYNGIRIGPNQLPHVYKLAVLAARLLGVPRMPDVYVSGDSMWNTYTFGSDNSSFIVLGTAILTNFKDDDLLFMLAREMGHCRAGHALWKTVVRFVAGDIGAHTGILSGGMLSAISPTKLIGSALEMPLMAWSRQSEITADRAGLLAIGDVALARRVLLTWSIRSATLLKQVNMEEWMKQEEASADQLTHISEMTTSSSMYTARRLRFLGQAGREPELMRWSESIQPMRKQLEAAQLPPKPGAPSVTASPSRVGEATAPLPAPKDSIRVICDKCHSAMRVPFTVLRGKKSLNVRCPQCQNVMTLRQKPTTPAPSPQP